MGLGDRLSLGKKEEGGSGYSWVKDVKSFCKPETTMTKHSSGTPVYSLPCKLPTATRVQLRSLPLGTPAPSGQLEA